MSWGESQKNNSVLFEYLLFASVLLYYIPHIPRFFMGDDWLWLAQSSRAMADFSQLFERAIYGYFRPLYMLYIGVMFKTVGLHAFWFGLANVLWHVCNCYLLLRVLRKLEFTQTAAYIAAVFFGFYYLEASAVCWISSGSDIITVTLLLTLTLLLIDYYEKFTMSKLLLIVFVCLAAVLVKELGFVGIVLYFVLPVLKKQNPFKGKYLGGTVLLLLLASVYLIYYFNTRTYIDKILLKDLKLFVVNLWYFFIYLFLPFSKRMITLFGAGHENIMVIMRGFFVFALPLVWFLLLKRKGTKERYFLLWPLILLTPVAMFDWSLGLFDLYPERTISRFMYAAIPGLAVSLGVIFAGLFDTLLRKRLVWTVVVVLFVVFNIAVVFKVTGLFKTRQQTSQDIYLQLNEHRDAFKNCDTLYIYLSDTAGVPSVLTNPLVMDAMGRVVFEREMPVRAFVVPDILEHLPEEYPGCTIKWLESERKLSPIWSITPERIRTK